MSVDSSDTPTRFVLFLLGDREDLIRQASYLLYGLKAFSGEGSEVVLVSDQSGLFPGFDSWLRRVEVGEEEKESWLGKAMAEMPKRI